MFNGSEKFLSSEKRNKFFPEKGAFTNQEIALSRSLAVYIKDLRIKMEGSPHKDLLIDQRWVRDKEAKFKKDRNEIKISNPEHLFAIERGELSEPAIIYGMNEGQWFGRGSKVRVASLFDDYQNGVDCVVELDRIQQLAIGIDTTISLDKTKEKLKRIRGNILSGQLAEVKYFQNENYTGSLHNVPLTVIGIDLEANRSLAKLIYDIETTDQSHSDDKLDKKEKAQEAIKKDKVLFIVLFEIKIQLKAFLELRVQALKGQLTPKEIDEDNIVKKLRAELVKFEEVIREKTPKDKTLIEKLNSEIKNDKVFKIIKQTLEEEFTEFNQWEEALILVAKIPPAK
jgi:hypothetical protein